jgi:hypothetical protein
MLLLCSVSQWECRMNFKLLASFTFFHKISRNSDVRADYDQGDELGKCGSAGTVDEKMLSFVPAY